MSEGQGTNMCAGTHVCDLHPTHGTVQRLLCQVTCKVQTCVLHPRQPQLGAADMRYS